MKKTLWLILALTLLLSGCGNGTFQTIDFENAATFPVEETVSFPTFSMAAAGAEMKLNSEYATEDGLFWETWENRTDAYGDYSVSRMMFTEFNTGLSYPLCAQANCTHDNENCPAFSSDGYSGVYYDGQWLYYMDLFGTQMWKMHPDGSERQVLFSMEADSEVQGVMLIATPVFYEDHVYFTSHCTYMDEEAGKLTTERRICVANLNSGAVTLVPYEFGGAVNSNDIQILGIYQNELFLCYTNRVMFPKERYDQSFFLLELDTQEITLLYQDSYEASPGDYTTRWDLDMEHGVVMFNVCKTESRVNPTDNTGETTAIWEGERYWFDLNTRKGYHLQSQTISSDEALIEGKMIFHRWNEAGTECQRMIYDLKTGIYSDHPANLANLAVEEIPGNSGQWYIVSEYLPEAHESLDGLIRKEDFWNGERNITVIPEWNQG